MTKLSLSRRTVRDVHANGFKSIASAISLTIINAMTATMMILIPELMNQTIRSMMSIFLMSRTTFAEDGRADANHRGALFDCYFKIVSHTHRQLALPSRKRTASRQFVSQLS